MMKPNGASGQQMLSAASLRQRGINMNMAMAQLGESAHCRSAWPTYGGFIDRFAAAYLA
jgi:hypothetical protein